MQHHAANRATANRDRQAWLKMKIAEARDGWHRPRAVDRFRRELAHLVREATRRGWTDPADDGRHDPALDRAA